MWNSSSCLNHSLLFLPIFAAWPHIISGNTGVKNRHELFSGFASGYWNGLFIWHLIARLYWPPAEGWVRANPLTDCTAEPSSPLSTELQTHSHCIMTETHRGQKWLEVNLQYSEEEMETDKKYKRGKHAETDWSSQRTSNYPRASGWSSAPVSLDWCSISGCCEATRWTTFPHLVHL